MNTKVTFESDNRTITVNFSYDSEKNELGYVIDVEPEYVDGESIDLPTILCSKLLDTLITLDDTKFETDEEVDNITSDN